MYTGRIARFDAPGKPFEIETVVLPGVGPGEILIKVTRANICGSDVHAWHGTFATRGLGGQLPTVLGHEMVGAIEALGEGVSADSNGAPLKTGTRVVFPYFFPLPYVPQLSDRTPQRLPEPEDGHARPR